MIYTYVATFLAGAISVGTGIYQVQEWRYAAKEKDRVESQLENERLSAKATIRQSEAVLQAQSNAASRARGLRDDAAGSRNALVSLSDAVDDAMRAAAASKAACTERITAFGDVLKTSADEYRGLAETCDRHVSDIKTLTEAWPK